jgi:Ca2+-binding RTX toxin-like protein
MLRAFWQRSVRRFTRGRRPTRNPIWHGRFCPSLETLGDRIVPSAVGFFTAAGHTLTVIGDTTDNSIVISRTAAGQILVNGGAVPILGGAPTVANTSLIQVFGLAGNDTITLNEANGALPAANLFGGAGNDVLTGGSGKDQLFGEAGNDILLGKGGNDLLFGGDGNDTITGGAGDDQVFGQAGNDRMIWNPGDGTDLNEGGAGTDTVEVNGGNGAETFTATPNGSRVRFDRITPAPFTIDIGTSENLVVNMNGGDDTFTGSNGLAGLISLTVDGGAGNDTITGGDGNDMLIGGDGNDLIVGGRGADTAIMGAGDDTFVWNPGDGSDVVEGQAGADTLQFNGANIAEQINLTANGQRLKFTRDVGNIVMDVDGTEQVNFAALGGADTITVGDLTGTAVTAVNLDLSAPAGSGTGDGAADTLIVTGTNGADNITVAGAGTSASVTGLAAQVNIQGAEGANDSLVVKAMGGNDGVSAAGLPSGVVKLTLDGGAGDDTILGSQGADMLLGGDGNDSITGNQGNDTAFMGAGDDVFFWSPGDGSDTVDGQDGTDKLMFFGSAASENFNLSANGSRVLLTRDVGNISMDLNGTERLELRTLGGADNVTVNDLSGTDMNHVELALRGPDGGGDGQSDSVTINGSQSADTISVGGDVGGLNVTGLAATVTIFDAEPTLDQLTVNGQGGDDVINAQSLHADAIRFVINGGDGNDTITGSDGADLVTGGHGNDTVFLGAGDDTFVWNPGDGSDTVEGQAGTDFLVFNGANIAENISLSANGSRVLLARDIGNVTMDLNGFENINVNTLGGADTVTVNDLTGTGVTDVNLGLSANGAGDGAVDTVVVNGTAGENVIAVAGDSTGVSVLGLAAHVNVTGAEPTDQLTVNAGAGDDVVDATSLAAGTIQLTVNGEDGNDVLIGSPGNDILHGGAGDDVLIGNGGIDVLDGGTGDNVVIA